MGPGVDSGGDFGSNKNQHHCTIIARLGFGSILEVILDPKIDNLGYRFCDHFCEVFCVAVGAFWNRFWRFFGVQRVIKSKNIEM